MKYLFKIAVLISFTSCMFTAPAEIGIEVEEVITLPEIPSASGLIIENDSAFIISDDAPFLYRLSLNDLRFSKLAISATDTSRSRLKKMFKRDLEAFAAGELNDRRYLFAFPSGGLSPYRDTMVRFDLNDLSVQQRISVLPLYEQIRQRIKAKVLNIEAAVISKDTLFLFDRISNTISSVHLPSLQLINAFSIELPVYRKVPAGFSGACLMKDGSILFSASLEDTKNMIADGDVLGSYIGILDLKNGIPTLRTADRVVKDGKPLLEKIESVDVTADGKIIAVVDNDDGTSKWIRLKIR